MARFIVGYEGRDTLDGRRIEPESTTPRRERIPILFEFRHEETMGWAEEFGRRLNPETGWTEISFECYLKDVWEQRVIAEKLTPVCMLSSPIQRTPYHKPEELDKTVISEAIISAVGFTVGPNAWGEYPK